MDSDSDRFGAILVMIALIALSGFFSATETAFSSLNHIRIRNLAENGNKRAALVLRLSDDFDRLLSTILVGNNIVNITLASMATAMFIRDFGDIGATLSTAVTTILVLIFGEVTPKSLSKESPESFAMFSAPAMRVLTVLLTPVNFLFRMWKKMLRKIFRGKSSPSITEEELLTIVKEAQQGGSIDRDEGELIQSAITFGDLRAQDIVTPRVDVEGLDRGAGCEAAAGLFRETGYSRLPVYDGTIDNIVGVIHLKDFYTRVYPDGEIASIIKPLPFVAPTMKVDDLLRLLQKEQSHMAVIADEYGGTVGIVTMEDILEELVGEIWDEHDEVVQDIRRVDERTRVVRGSMDWQDCFHAFGWESDSEASTVSGWVMEQLGRVPSEGDTFSFGGCLITVTKTEDKRLLEISVTEPPSEETEQAEEKR